MGYWLIFITLYDFVTNAKNPIYNIAYFDEKNKISYIILGINVWESI